MKQLLGTEQAMQLAIAILALYFQPIHMAWWLWVILFLSPDVAMLGYLWNTRVGALLYNLAHYKALAGVLIIVGFAGHLPVIYLSGLLIWAHSSFDRMMGYGLKYPDAFKHTHLQD